MINAAERSSMIPEPQSTSVDAQVLIKIKRMMLFTQEDEQYLTMAGALLAPHAGEILNRWYEHIVSNNYLSHYFTNSGAPDLDYLNSLRPHFNTWITALCNRSDSHRWWEFEERIARQLQLRNVPLDDLHAISPVYLRYMTTFVFPVSEAGRFFIDRAGYDAATTAAIHQAWFKAVSLSALLWIYPEGKPAPF